MRVQLEQKYKSVSKTKRYVGYVLTLHLLKTAITVGVLCIALLIGGFIAGRLVSRKVGNVAQTVENIVEKIVDELRDEINKTEKVRLAGLTQNPAVTDHDNLRLINVSYQLDLANTRRLEIKGLLETMEALKISTALLISSELEETMESSGKKITILPLWKWLLKGT